MPAGPSTLSTKSRSSRPRSPMSAKTTMSASMPRASSPRGSTCRRPTPRTPRRAGRGRAQHRVEDREPVASRRPAPCVPRAAAGSGAASRSPRRGERAAVERLAEGVDDAPDPGFRRMHPGGAGSVAALPTAAPSSSRRSSPAPAARDADDLAADLARLRAPPPTPIATWSPIRAWCESPAISSAAVPTAVTRPTRRWFGMRASSAASAENRSAPETSAPSSARREAARDSGKASAGVLVAPVTPAGSVRRQIQPRALVVPRHAFGVTGGRERPPGARTTGLASSRKSSP